MKQFVFVLVILSGSIEAFAQVKIGLQLSPSISGNRGETRSEPYTLKNDGYKVRFRFGIITDLPLADNYYFSTGLIYAPKRVAIKVTPTLPSGLSVEEYNLQYLQIPLTMKLYTNEITLETRLFFNLGANAEIAISEKFDRGSVVIKDFKFFDTSLVLGAGVEYKIGANTAVYGAISYNRGLINPISESMDTSENILLKNDLICLDLGIKF